MRSGEEIQSALRAFAASWRGYSGSERGEAQTFLNELIACYGADRRAVGARFEDAHTADGIMDLYWPDVCIIEMKAPHRAEKLSEHRKQALEYWRTSDDVAQNRAAPPYVVLCAFQRFEVWEPGRFPSNPRADFTLDKLPENYEKLLFLSGTDQEPLFGDSYKELTTDAVKVMWSFMSHCGSAKQPHRRRCALSSCKLCGACLPRILGCWETILFSK